MSEIEQYFEQGEKIVLSSKITRKGRLNISPAQMVLTQKALYIASRNLLGNINGVIRLISTRIRHVNVECSENNNEEANYVLKLVYDNLTEKILFANASIRVYRTWEIAIRDLMKDCIVSNTSYYRDMMNDDYLRTIPGYNEEDKENKKEDNQYVKFAKDVGKEFVKSGRYSTAGLQRSIEKTTKRYVKDSINDYVGDLSGERKSTTKESLSTKIKEGIKEELGINEIKRDIQTGIQEEVFNIKNDLRKMAGLKPVETEQQKEEKRLNEAFEKNIELTRLNNQELKKSDRQYLKFEKEMQKRAKTDLNESKRKAIEGLEQLLEFGIISQDDYENKVKEILSQG